MPGQTGMVQTHTQGVYIPQYNPSITPAPGQIAMHYPPGPLPPQQQHAPITAPPVQLSGQSNAGSANVTEMSNALGSTNRIPGGNDAPLSGAPFDMSSMASSLAQQPGLANPYNPHQVL